MKKYLAAAVSLAAIIMAAPCIGRRYGGQGSAPAPLPAIYDWTGFYIGGNGGWGQSHNCGISLM